MFKFKRSVKNRLPESFLFGVATADHQCEAYDERYEDIQDLWERQRNLVKREQATDFWNRYAEDIALAQQIGCKAFRLSLSWARLEPSAGSFNDEGFAHYRQLLQTIRDAGMVAIVTLHHYTWPIHVEKRGGSISPDFPTIFATYAEEAVKRLGDLIEYWITFNEPNQLVYGYFKAGNYKLPPGLPLGTSVKEQMQAIRKLIPNLFEANARARTVIHKSYPQAKVGTNSFLFGLPSLFRWFVDWQVTRLREEDWEKVGYRYTEQSLLWKRDVDIVVAMFSVTPERKEQIDFSEVYYVDGLRLLVPISSQFQKLTDLEGKKVGVVDDSTAAKSIFEIMPKSEDVEFIDLQAARIDLENGSISAILADESGLQGLMVKYPDQYKLIGDRLSEEHYAVGVAKGNPMLLDAIDLAVQNFHDGIESERIYHQNLSLLSDTTKVPQNVPNRSVLENLHDEHQQLQGSATSNGLSKAEKYTWLNRIQERGYLIAAVRDDAPGFGYFDPKTQAYSGLEIDLARKIAEIILGDPDKVEFRPVKTKERISKLSSIFQIFDPILRAFSTLSTIFNSNWWNLGMAGKLPEFLCPAGCDHQQDFVGFDYYWGSASFWPPQRIIQLLNASQGEYTKAPVWSKGLYQLIKRHARLFPDQEIFIVENGCVVEADNLSQAEYIRAHIQEIKQAYQDGFNVKGYIYWSITSNREWGYKFGPDSNFGLYHIDLDNDPHLRRIPTDSVAVYRDVIRDR